MPRGSAGLNKALLLLWKTTSFAKAAEAWRAVANAQMAQLSAPGRDLRTTFVGRAPRKANSSMTSSS